MADHVHVCILRISAQGFELCSCAAETTETGEIVVTVQLVPVDQGEQSAHEQVSKPSYILNTDKAQREREIQTLLPLNTELNPRDFVGKHVQNAQGVSRFAPYAHEQVSKDEQSMGEFDQWWVKYPRKRARKRALKVWKALKDRLPLAQMMQTLAWQCEEWAESESKFTPYPDTYLRGGDFLSKKQDPPKTNRGPAQRDARDIMAKYAKEAEE